MMPELHHQPHHEPAVFRVETHQDVNELKQNLQTSLRTTDSATRRDSLKRVLTAMNQSLDVSNLFAEMVQASATGDLVQKRMVLQYLGANAALNPDLAILAVNTLLKDCESNNPHVRCMGLSSLISLGSTDVLEYIDQPITAALRDRDADVRANGIDTCLKLFELVNKEGPTADDIKTRVTICLSDPHLKVFTRAVMALITIDPSTVQGVQHVVYRVLNSLQDHVIDPILLPVLLQNVILPYQPDSMAEYYDILNILDSQLEVMDINIVCSVISCFLRLFKKHSPEETSDQALALFERTADILVTHLACCHSFEMSAIVVSCIILIVQEVNNVDLSWGLLSEHLDLIVPQLNDPPYLTDLKLKLLETMSCDASRTVISERILELIDPLISLGERMGEGALRRSVEMLGRLYDSNQHGILLIAIDSVRRALHGELERRAFAPFANLIRHIDRMGDIKPFLRKYPDTVNELARAFHWMAEHDSDVFDLKSMIQLLSCNTFIEHMDELPYIFETLVERILVATEVATPSRCATTVARSDMDEGERKTHVQKLLTSHYDKKTNQQSERDMLGLSKCWMLVNPLMTALTNLFLQRPKESGHFVSAMFERIISPTGSKNNAPYNLVIRTIKLYDWLNTNPSKLRKFFSEHQDELEYKLFGVEKNEFAAVKETIPAMLLMDNSLMNDQDGTTMESPDKKTTDVVWANVSTVPMSRPISNDEDLLCVTPSVDLLDQQASMKSEDLL